MEHLHDDDPTAGPDPWDEFQAKLGAVKDHFKATYNSASGGGGPSEEEVNSALSTLGAVWNQVADTVGAALKDPETRDQLKEVAGSFASALGVTLSQLGDALNDSEEE